MTKEFSKDITSYDLMKTLAVGLMIVDHIGFYFYPEDNWWRVVGRVCVPIWFYLIGYARSRDLGPRMWIGGALLIAGDMVIGHYVLPLNILFTMIIMRLAVDPLMRTAIRTPQSLAPLGALMLTLGLPTMALFEYGTIGLILTATGWLARHESDPDVQASLSRDTINYYWLFAYIAYVIMQVITFGFDQPQFMVMAAGVFFSFGLIYFFKPATYPGLTKGLGSLAGVLRFTGRRTLEIYVAHLLLFKGLALLTQPDRFHLFQWKWLMMADGG